MSEPTPMPTEDVLVTLARQFGTPSGDAMRARDVVDEIVSLRALVELTAKSAETGWVVVSRGRVRKTFDRFGVTSEVYATRADAESAARATGGEVVRARIVLEA